MVTTTAKENVQSKTFIDLFLLIFLEKEQLWHSAKHLQIKPAEGEQIMTKFHSFRWSIHEASNVCTLSWS